MSPPSERAAGRQDGSSRSKPGQKFRHEIASDVSLSGRISFNADARIDGRLKGEVRAHALLVIGPQAQLHADVRAERLIVEGQVIGNVRESGSVELLPGCRVVGDIEAGHLVVHEGAVFEGRCIIHKHTPTQVAEEAAAPPSASAPPEQQSSFIRAGKPAGPPTRPAQRAAKAPG